MAICFARGLMRLDPNGGPFGMRGESTGAPSIAKQQLEHSLEAIGAIGRNA